MWDKTAYRVSRIPETFDSHQLSQAIKLSFGLENGAFRIHTLALDATDETEPRWKAATVSFRVRPVALQAVSGQAHEWIIDVPRSLEAGLDSVRLVFDTHFYGFTPLSPAEKVQDQTIE